jgi:G3E family GTPase
VTANLALPIPMTVLTGFLGSGKTTLLKALLQHPAMAGTAVIINEFGAVGLDHTLVEKTDEDTVLLPSGCVCCAVRGDLVKALTRLHQQAMWGEIPPIARAVLETSGLADPAPIAHTVITEKDLFRVYRLDGVVATADAQHGLDQLDQHYEPAKQIAVADRIVLTKTDLVGPVARAALEARLKALNPAARIMTAVKGDISPHVLFGLGAYEVRGDGMHAGRWLAAESYRGHDHACAGEGCTDPAHAHHHHHHEHGQHCVPDCGHGHDGVDPRHLHGISSFCLTFDKPLDGRKLSFAIELLRGTHGNRLLRVKGIVDVLDQPVPFIIHGVQHVFYPPETLAAWPPGERRSRIVFITRDLPEEKVRAVFAPLFDEAAALVPPGFGGGP